ncbi:MAG: DNA-protecting protein DprA [Bifidobacteriaceae bacterium]|jgi:DNA processing protein|nr:DNA-protecting protein DprA [Bifidobacteriaceae bacterium]
MKQVPRDEVVALLALLRLRPNRMTWEAIGNQVSLEGSAQAVLSGLGTADGTLFPDPGTLARVTAERAAAESALAKWEADKLTFVTILSDQYPEQLAGVFDAPPLLFYRGDLRPDDRGMSVVGSRKASPEGLALAAEAARILVRNRLTVIAGLAAGIDTAAHRAALDAGGRTVAVLGTGISRYYPAANHELQNAIAETGLLLSQFYPDEPPTRNTFPKRNGTMSGYGLATIIIEAGEYSGARIQARKAAGHGRPLILTEQVAQTTSWGKELAAQRETWVRVVSTPDEIEAAVADLAADPISRMVDQPEFAFS